MNMDVYEKITSMEFSLRTICSVSIIQRIFESIGLPPRGHPARFYIKEDWAPTGAALNDEVTARVRQLKLPQQVLNTLEGLVKPVYIELDRWYNRYQFRVRPMWSPHGTVDLAQSTRAIVEDTELPNRHRYMVACAFCHEQHIFEIAPLLTQVEMYGIREHPYDREPGHTPRKCSRFHRPWHHIARFWTEVYISLMDEQRSWLHRAECGKGLTIALQDRIEVAVKYFIGIEQADGIEDIVRKRILTSSLGNDVGLLPATHCLLFSKIRDQEYRQQLTEVFARSLLMKLLVWPYQTLFLDVASALSEDVSEGTIYRMLMVIANKAADGYRDCNYRELFIGLWEMFVHRWRETRLAVQYRTRMILHALLTEDEQWIGFVFSKYSAEDHEQILLRDGRYGICSYLIMRQKYRLLEPFFRACGADDIDVLVKFWCKLQEMIAFPYSRVSYYSDQAMFENKTISKILEKIITEHPSASARLRSLTGEPQAEEKPRSGSCNLL